MLSVKLFLTEVLGLDEDDVVGPAVHGLEAPLPFPRRRFELLHLLLQSRLHIFIILFLTTALLGFLKLGCQKSLEKFV